MVAGNICVSSGLSASDTGDSAIYDFLSLVYLSGDYRDL
jgi:hypothetical protein